MYTKIQMKIFGAFTTTHFIYIHESTNANISINIDLSFLNENTKI